VKHLPETQTIEVRDVVMVGLRRPIDWFAPVLSPVRSAFVRGL
jgi:hypothetical protein